MNYLSVLKWLSGSLDVSEQGASAKKLTSFFLVAVAIILEIIYVDHENFIDLVEINLFTAAAMLGVATIDKLTRRKQDQTATTEQKE